MTSWYPGVIAALLYQILTDQNVRQQVTLVRENNRETLEEQQADRETILGNIKGTKKKISNLVDTIETRGGNPQLYERLDKREDEMKQLEIQLDGLDESAQDQLEFLNNPERIIACALDLRTYIESEDPEIARMFILSFVNKVVVQGKQAIIHYRIPLPRDPKGNPNPTETVSLKKGAESKSCLSPAWAGICPITIIPYPMLSRPPRTRRGRHTEGQVFPYTTSLRRRRSPGLPVLR